MTIDTGVVAARAQALFDRDAPLAALAARGIAPEIRVLPNDGGTRVEHVWALPGRSPVQASFVREDLRAKLTKLMKGELQLGDPRFDGTVYVSTETPAETRVLLLCAGVVDAIVHVVEHGGVVSLDESAVKIEAEGATLDAIEGARHEAWLVAHVLGLLETAT